MKFFEWKRRKFERGFRLTIVGVTLSAARHLETTPAPNGGNLAILWSVWLSTRRRAIGFGKVQDWCRPLSLELRISAGSFITESGNLQIEPPVRVDPQERFEVLIVNHSTVTAKGWIEAGYSGELSYRNSACFEIDAGGQVRIELDLLGTEFPVFPFLKRPMIVNHLSFSTIPTGRARLSRIYGRPEFGRMTE